MPWKSFKVFVFTKDCVHGGSNKYLIDKQSKEMEYNY